MHAPAGAARGAAPETPPLDVAIVIPAKHEVDNLRVLLPQLQVALNALNVGSQIVVVTTERDRGAEADLRRLGATTIVQLEPGCGTALQAGFAAANATYDMSSGFRLYTAGVLRDRLF